MWPFNNQDSTEPEFHCDGQVTHEYQVVEEMEMVYLNRYYDPAVDAEVVVLVTVPRLAECRRCDETIENHEIPWTEGGSFTSFSDYDLEFTKVVVNDCSDAERIDSTEEFR